MGDAATNDLSFATRSRHAESRGSFLHRGYEYLVFYGLLAAFGVSSLVWSLVATILYYLLPRRLGEPLGQLMIMGGCRYFVGLMRLSGVIKCDLGALDRLRHA